MIESIFLAREGCFGSEGESMNGLKLINYVFGPNASGKTTISRVIENPARFEHCTLSWKAGTPLECLVYNKDFVDRHFSASESIPGIYTFGENIEISAEIARLKSAGVEFGNGLATLKGTLSGDDGDGGKTKEKIELKDSIIKKLWRLKTGYGEFKPAFRGLNNRKNTSQIDISWRLVRIHLISYLSSN